MRAVVQRVSEATVTVDGVEISRIGVGLMVLAAVGKGDHEKDVALLAQKLVGLRIFADESGKMNRDIIQINGALLLVSQFTLFGDARKGNRPSFDAAEEPTRARYLFDLLVTSLASHGVPLSTGQFRAHMRISLTNEGPITILLDTRKQF